MGALLALLAAVIYGVGGCDGERVQSGPALRWGAAAVLRERIHRLQALGLLASAVAIALIVSAT